MQPEWHLGMHPFPLHLFSVCSAGASTPPGINASAVPSIAAPIGVNGFSTLPPQSNGQPNSEPIYTNGIHPYPGEPIMADLHSFGKREHRAHCWPFVCPCGGLLWEPWVCGLFAVLNAEMDALFHHRVCNDSLKRQAGSLERVGLRVRSKSIQKTQTIKTLKVLNIISTSRHLIAFIFNWNH